MIPTKTVAPSSKAIAVRDEMIALMRAKMADVDPAEMLAVVSYTVGQLLALQDQRKMTPAMGLQIISDNIEAGNAQAIKEVLSTDGTPQ